MVQLRLKKEEKARKRKLTRILNKPKQMSSKRTELKNRRYRKKILSMLALKRPNQSKNLLVRSSKTL